LADAHIEDGGFFTVPGYHKYLKDWTEKTHRLIHAKRFDSTYDFVPVPYEDNMTKQGRAIPLRAGSLLIWRSEQPHCNTSNDSCNFRINQYIKMFPAQEKGRGTDERVKQINKSIPKDFQISELGSKLFGLSSWTEK